MSYVLNAQVFEARGDDWAALARREQKPAGLVLREVKGPSWNELDHRWEIEGFDPDGEPGQVSQRWTVPSPQRREVPRDRLFVEMRNENAPLYRTPEYRRVAREGETMDRHPEAKEVPLTPEMQLKRKHQQAAVKARMTRAANRLKAAEAERLALVEALRVKLSQKI